MPVEYVNTADLPDLGVQWLDSASTIIDFHTGYTFTIRIGREGETALVTKTTGITGAATSPNIVIVWAAGELAVLPKGTYVLQIEARTGGKDRILSHSIIILTAVT